MVSGTLKIRNNIYYVVLYWNENSKQKQFTFSTKIKATSKKAEKEALSKLMEARLYFNPMDLNTKNKFLTRKSKNLKKQHPSNDSIFNLSVADYFQWALDTLKTDSYSIATIKTFSFTIQKIKEYSPFQEIKFIDLEKKEVSNFFDYLLEKKLAASSVNLIKINMGRFYEIAVEKEIVDFNLIKRIKKKHQKRKSPLTFSKEEITSFFKIIHETHFELEFCLLLTYGLRKGELLGLKIEDINFKENFLEIRRSLVPSFKTQKGYFINEFLKTNHSRRIFPLTEKIKKLLEKRIEEISVNKNFFKKDYSLKNQFINPNGKGNLKDFLIVDNDGKIIQYTRINNELKKIIMKNNLHYINIHGLRHTCATLLHQNNIDIRNIQKWLGHSNISTTSIYAKYDNRQNMATFEEAKKIFK